MLCKHTRPLADQRQKANVNILLLFSFGQNLARNELRNVFKNFNTHRYTTDWVEMRIARSDNLSY